MPSIGTQHQNTPTSMLKGISSESACQGRLTRSRVRFGFNALGLACPSGSSLDSMFVFQSHVISMFHTYALQLAAEFSRSQAAAHDAGVRNTLMTAADCQHVRIAQQVDDSILYVHAKTSSKQNALLFGGGWLAFRQANFLGPDFELHEE